jgi:hypothetical protein
MNICVFCGSGIGTNPIFSESAKKLAAQFVYSGTSLVYGGGNIGLMGVIADEVLKGGGKVIGVIPDFLMKREVGHTGLTELEVVGSMHERKRRMCDLSDAFIAMPGGWGTLDELAEILTWKQLGLIHQPIGILDVNSFFSHLLAQMEHMVASGFLKAENLRQIHVSDSPSELLTLLGVNQK